MESFLSDNELIRYRRQMSVPEIGRGGQEKLKNGSALIVGLGGLGSPLALYLAAAGVGRLGLIDFDRVDESNLQRQVLYRSSNIGRSKIAVARRELLDLNPHLQLDIYEEPLQAPNALEIARKYDVVADGSDNFATRYLVNDACVLANKPNVHASIFRLEGRLSVFGYRDGPCYRCLFEEPPPPGSVPSCGEAGVLGATAGVLGSLQATEVLKILLGMEGVASGRLLLYDAARLEFRSVRVQKQENCPSCGSGAKIDLSAHQMPEEREEVAAPEVLGENDLSPGALKDMLERGEKIVLLDVRESAEREIAELENSVLIPLPQLMKRMQELDPEKLIVVYCKVGERSAIAQELLRERGFSRVKNLQGGILRWAREIDPNMAIY